MQETTQNSMESQDSMDLDHDSLPQEDDKEPTIEDEKYARYFRQDDVVFSFAAKAELLKKTKRFPVWGRVKKVEGGWITVQTGKSEKSLFKAHATSLYPLNDNDMRFVEPGTGRVALSIPNFYEETKEHHSNPWVLYVIFGDRYIGESRTTIYQNLHDWERKEKVDFVDEFDDFTGYRAFLDQLPRWY